MPSAAQSALRTVALIGNPNTGKSTIFGVLAGVRQRVGNYPGVTVEKKTGRMRHKSHPYELIDLPGLYSLAPRSQDEMVTVDVLLGRFANSRPVDAVLCVVDASNLTRNLYLVSQLLELHLPTVVALNMTDVAKTHGVVVDRQALEQELGVPVIEMQANRGVGVSKLKSALHKVIERDVPAYKSPLPEQFESEIERLSQAFAEETDHDETVEPIAPFLLQRLILDSAGYLQKTLLPEGNGQFTEELTQCRARLAEAGHEVPGVETTARYGWVQEVLDSAVQRPRKYKVTLTDRIDHVLTNRFWGTCIFALVMMVVFQAVFSWAGPFMNMIDGVFGVVGEHLAGWMGAIGIGGGALESLMVDGVIAGVGGVIIFLPQILILFLFIAVLEDCGYMARAAYLMDRLMSRIGLSGKSFIPLISSFACAIPGIMAARVIEDRRDRLTTILVAPLMTCSARLPVYALLIAAFVPEEVRLKLFGYKILGLQGATLAGLYLLGVVAAVLVALVLKRTVLRGVTPPFVLELPSYKWPSLRTCLHRVIERGWLFVRCAGTIILAVSILVWATLYFPRNDAAVEADAGVQQLRAELAAVGPDNPSYPMIEEELDRKVAGAHQRHSFLGQAGNLVEPIFRPLGWDWRISCAVIASFPAREVVVASLGVIFNLGDEVDAETEEGASAFTTQLREATWADSDRKLFTLPVAMSLMVFFALCAQCAATLAVIRRETNSWRWPIFTFGYMTALAYVAAFVTFQVGTWMGG